MNPSESEVLELVNKIRTQALKLNPLTRLPKGRLMRSNSCPLARALHAHVDEDFLVYQDEGIARTVAMVLSCDVEGYSSREYVVKYMPDLFKNFIAGFDRKGYPELIEA